MKRTWQIWVLFSLCLLAIAIAMSWLSLKVIKLDALRETDRAETEMARREAELQERISSALYRMDLKMLPLISQEAARPIYFYQMAAADAPVSDWVRLYFQVATDDTITPTHLPTGANEITEEKLLTNERLAAELFDYQSLLRETSQQVAYHAPAIEDLRDPIAIQTVDSSALQATNKFELQQSRGIQRVNEEFNQRRDSTQEITQQTWANNQAISNEFLNEDAIAGDDRHLFLESEQAVPMQPVWMKEHLVLTRRVADRRGVVVQCCWLNWEKIKADLQTEVAALLPEVDFESVMPDTPLHIGTALTTIPVQLIVDRPKMLSRLAFDSPVAVTDSVLPASLIAAWCGLLLAGVCSAM